MDERRVSILIPTVKVPFHAIPPNHLELVTDRSGIERKQGMRHFKSRCRHEPFLCTFHIVSQHLARTLVRNDNRSIDRLIREKQFPVRAPCGACANAPAANVSATRIQTQLSWEILSIV